MRYVILLLLLVPVTPALAAPDLSNPDCQVLIHEGDPGPITVSDALSQAVLFDLPAGANAGTEYCLSAPSSHPATLRKPSSAPVTVPHITGHSRKPEAP